MKSTHHLDKQQTWVKKIDNELSNSYTGRGDLCNDFVRMFMQKQTIFQLGQKITTLWENSLQQHAV